MATGKTPAPTQAALKRLAELAQKGVGSGRMQREVESIVANWLGQPGADSIHAEAREWLAEIRDELTAGVSDAAEQADDLDRSDTVGLRHAEKSLAALAAARDALVRAYASL
ncbi:hypothetical protein [Roseomonas sp. BN140053]|uniref:hypothetical protein n=1 Tax=Roseomonas sp. BN140053 TaxID=3391898 RepID=UPI0039E8CF64